MVEPSRRQSLNHGTGWSSILDPLRQASQKVADFFTPNAEASSDENFYEIEVELPGVDESEIEVTLDGDNMVVTGEKNFERKEEGRTYYFTERTYGRFRRSFRLPGDADPDKIAASHKNGVLTIKIAKAAVDAARKITIDKG